MKDWTGNRNSVASMLGMKTVWHPEDREPNDFYSTDPKAVDVLHDLLEHRCGYDNCIIYECACGTGNISKKLEAMGYVVVSTDIVDRGYGVAGIDFLKVNSLPDGCTTIITNPPYRFATEFILHALDLLPENGTAAFFMNISYLSGKDRYRRLYATGALEKIIVFSNRVHCYKNDVPSGHSSPVNYAWYIFRKGNTLAPKIEWTSV